MFASLIQAALVAALALSTLATPARAQDAPQPACAPVAFSGDPVTVNGTGQSNSAPFTLTGGAYQVDWAFATPSTIASFVNLRSVASENVMDVIYNGTPQSASSGQTFAYNVKPGAYYLQVRVPAGWSVTLTPISA
jgi:hypothetical protein